MSKRATLLLIVILAVSSLIVVKAVPALASIPKLSVPEFTVKLIDSSYDVPTTYSIDPYTGENVTHAGYHVERRSIEVKIKNQPFAPYWIQDSDGNNWTINFFYNIRIKGHFSEDWRELYSASDGYPTQSDSQYTILLYVLGEKMPDFPDGGQVDFQVETMIGYVSRKYTGNYGVFSYPWVFTGETSGWSNTQTLTIPASTSSPASSPSPTSTPDQTPEPTPKAIETIQFETILGVIVAVTMIGAGSGLLICYFIKRKSRNTAIP